MENEKIKNFTLAAMFMAGAFANAIPGIVLQMILIPTIMVALNKTGLVPFSNKLAKASLLES